MIRFRFAAVVAAFALIVSILPAEAVKFPIKASANGRYLVDADDKPFLFLGDTGWKMLWRLSLADAGLYLDTRKAQGFNAVLTVFAPWPQDRKDGKVTNGLPEPFQNNDLSKPNETFWAFADQVVAAAASRNMMVLGAALWLGCCGEGWDQVLSQNSVEQAKAYGTFLGNRYKNSPNVAFFLGGDNSRKDAKVDAIGDGILAADPTKMISCHGNHQNARAAQPTASWLTMGMVYGYSPDYESCCQTPHFYQLAWNEYNAKPAKPFIFGEGFYEGEHDNAPRSYTTADYRKQSYWVILGGGSGGSMAHGRVWSFDTDWKDKINAPLAKTLGHLPAAFEGRAWYKLLPDPDGKFVTQGAGSKGTFEYVVSAYADDGTVGYAYLPPKRAASQPITVDLTQLKGNLKASWFDPSDGTSQAIDGSPFKAEGSKAFTPPAKNNEGSKDFLLILESDLVVATTPQLPRGTKGEWQKNTGRAPGILRGNGHRSTVKANGRLTKSITP